MDIVATCPGATLRAAKPEEAMRAAVHAALAAFERELAAHHEQRRHFGKAPGPRPCGTIAARGRSAQALPAQTAGIALAMQAFSMNLADMLDRCHGLESRVAALYRSFAAGAGEPDLRALWTAMAREEEEHARILDAERAHVPTVEAWLTDLSNWDEVVSRIEAKLSEAELLASGAGADQQLAAALELEMTEIEPVRQMLVAASERRPPRPIARNHALRLADAAERFSTDPHVRQQAALLRVRARAW